MFNANRIKHWPMFNAFLIIYMVKLQNALNIEVVFNAMFNAFDPMFRPNV